MATSSAVRPIRPAHRSKLEPGDELRSEFCRFGLLSCDIKASSDVRIQQKWQEARPRSMSSKRQAAEKADQRERRTICLTSGGDRSYAISFADCLLESQALQ